jgi:hypothetical protein
MTTDTEHITKLREATGEAGNARMEVITEIARLTTALRAAEAERDAALASANGKPELYAALEASLADAEAFAKDAKRLAECLTLVMPNERALRMSAQNFAYDEIISSACQRRDWESAAQALAAHRSATGSSANAQKAVTG